MIDPFSLSCHRIATVAVAALFPITTTAPEKHCNAGERGARIKIIEKGATELVRAIEGGAIRRRGRLSSIPR
jgi:hypothetical protein